jgi:hypothetical protein
MAAVADLGPMLFGAVVGLLYSRSRHIVHLGYSGELTPPQPAFVLEPAAKQLFLRLAHYRNSGVHNSSDPNIHLEMAMAAVNKVLSIEIQLANGTVADNLDMAAACANIQQARTSLSAMMQTLNPKHAAECKILADDVWVLLKMHGQNIYQLIHGDVSTVMQQDPREQEMMELARRYGIRVDDDDAVDD